MRVDTNLSSARNIGMRGALNDIQKTIHTKYYIPEEDIDKSIAKLPKSFFSSEKISYFWLDKEDRQIYKDIKRKQCKNGQDIFVTPDKIKNYYAHAITRINEEEYNGIEATVTRNLTGMIVSVNTGANNPQKACEDMGLAELSESYIVSPVPAVYGKKEGGNPAYYVWNYQTNSMDRYFGNMRPEWSEENYK